MSLRRQDARPDRRRDDGLRFDPLTGRLELGIHVRELAPGSGNREVLDAYVELTAWCRGERVAEVVEVRQGDLEALAAALDLDAGDLDALVQHTLGATEDDAQRLVARLRDTRLLGGITRAALGGVLAGALVTGCGTTGGNAKASVATRPPAPTTTTTTTTVDAQPTALIPPAAVDRPG